MSSDGTVSQQIARFVCDVEFAGIPEPVVETASLHALDTLGCGLAGYALSGGGYALAAAADSGTSGPCAAIGVPGGLAPADAVVVNGVLCHVLDFDDTHPDSVVHVNAVTTPACLALGQAYGRTASEVLTALVIGNEVSVRVGAAAPGRFHARGFHPTGVAGVFGATAAAARLGGLDAAQTAHALGIAGSMAGGLLEFLSDGAQTKPVHAGWAAHAGLWAARLASHGATGPAAVFEGARGFFAAYLNGEKTDISTQVSTLGTEWVTSAIAYKAYPSCHYTHASIDALSELMRAESLRAEDIESMVAFTNDTGIGLVLEPAADKIRPRTPYDSKFSMPYCLAYQLVHGTVDVTSFLASSIDDPAVLALTSRVSYERRDYNPGGDSFGGGVRLHTTRGATFELEVPRQRGSAENPLRASAVVEKFRTNAALALADGQVERVESTILGLRDGGDLTGLDTLGAALVAGPNG